MFATLVHSTSEVHLRRLVAAGERRLAEVERVALSCRLAGLLLQRRRGLLQLCPLLPAALSQVGRSPAAAAAAGADRRTSVRGGLDGSRRRRPDAAAVPGRRRTRSHLRLHLSDPVLHGFLGGRLRRGRMLLCGAQGQVCGGVHTAGCLPPLPASQQLSSTLPNPASLVRCGQVPLQT